MYLLDINIDRMKDDGLTLRTDQITARSMRGDR